MSQRKDITKLLRELRRSGYTIELLNGGHYKATPPVGRHTIISQTPSCPSALGNIRADLRRAQRETTHGKHAQGHAIPESERHNRAAR